MTQQRYIMAEISGLRFGRLVAVKPSHKEHGMWKWECLCDCGTNHYAFASTLKRGLVLSCGCLKRELLGARRRTHGKSATLTYERWGKMIQRCTNSRVKAYPHYGGRGITVCERWRSFENFLSDMGECAVGKSLERIDVNGNYEPGNCKWIPRNEQPMNTRRARFVTYKGTSKSIGMWCKELGLRYSKVYDRIHSKGWDVARAFET